MITRESEFQDGVRRLLAYLSVLKNFENPEAEEKRQELLKEASLCLTKYNSQSSGFTLWRALEALSKMEIDYETRSNILQFKEFFHGYF